MSTSSLRVYYGPDGEEALDTAVDLPQDRSTVTVGLGEIRPHGGHQDSVAQLELADAAGAEQRVVA